MVDADEVVTAPIDESDLSEILGNLIENAARFAKSSIRIDAASMAGGTTITVADDGPGIADADKEAVLSRGVRLDTNTGGNGLGLAIVSDIVEAYGGTPDHDGRRAGIEGHGLSASSDLTRPGRLMQIPGRSPS